VTKSPEQIVRAFCAGIGNRDAAAMAALLADDVEALNVGFELYRGKRAVLDHYAAPGGVWSVFPDRVDFRIRNLGVAGDRVYTERVDVLSREGREARLPVLGVFEIEGGKIRAWREYFDMGLCRRLLGGEKLSVEQGLPPGTQDA
jgi:limonene-1,2-epoxide hydrolase